MDWEPTGPEATFLQRSHTLSSDPDHYSHTKLSESASGRRESGSSTRGSLSSLLWRKFANTQDITMTRSTTPVSKDNAPKQPETVESANESNSLDTNIEVAKETATAPKETTITLKETTAAPKEAITTPKVPEILDSANSRRRRWSIFGYGIKDDDSGNTPPSKLRKSGDVLIESDSMSPGNRELESAAAQNFQERIKSPHALTHPSNSNKSVATIIVEESNVEAAVPGSSDDDDSKTGQSNTSRPASSTYNWLSIIPGYGSRSASTSELPSHRNPDQQAKNHEEDGIKSTNMGLSDLENSDSTRTLAEMAAEKNGESGFNSIEGKKKEGQTFAELKESMDKEVDMANDTISSLSKAILTRAKKNVVLPDYYEQYPDARHMSSFLFRSDPDLNSKHKRSPSIMKSAVDAINSLIFTKGSSTSMCDDEYCEGVKRIRRVVIIGVHGWFPRKLIRSVIGEPTGTSKKFCEEMDSAVKDYFKLHHSELDSDDVTLIPLEGEGKIMDRVEILYQNLVKNKEWIKSLEHADLVLISTHSQGTPTSTILISRLIKEGMIRTQEGDPRMQQVGMLAMAGISHGPFPHLKGNLIVRMEAEPAQELFDFMDPGSDISKKYHEALKVVLSSGARITVVASLEDQVVPLHSAVMSSIYHPSIVRAVYINGATYQDDFLTNLISFSLRLRNSGVDDHGVLLHLSEVIAGSIYGKGHSSIYMEREVYTLAIRALLEPPGSLTSKRARSEPIIHPLYANQKLNPFYLPWGMRGVIEDIKALGSDILDQEIERLKNLYDQWTPVSKGMKEIKFRLEPLVGHASIGKRRLASCIRTEITSQSGGELLNAELESKSNTNVSFRTSEDLPLDGSGLRAPVLSILRPLDVTLSINPPMSTLTGSVESVLRYDLILLMVNMSNLVSWETAKRSLLQLDPRWLLGRCALVITRVSAVSKYAFDRDDITNFIDQFYNIPILWTNLDIDSEATLTAQQIVRILGVNAGYRSWEKSSPIGGHSRPLTSQEIVSIGKELRSSSGTSASLWNSSLNLYPGLTLGSRSTTTYSLAKCPEKYNVEGTTRN
ncbi:hypothetical protein BGZ76_005470 [Entomortierella beljakovae]|nr:hypothetical protein BGZ76_005470 [Entomortierella beljakovae]